MKTLLILRHGQASPADKDTPRDYDRALTPRGIEEAQDAGLVAKAFFTGKTLVIASAALRTAQTAQWFLHAFGHADLETRELLYHASPSDWLEQLFGCPEDLAHVVFVGHNPAVSELCTQLSGKTLDLPTGGFAAFSAPNAPWTELHASDWRLFVPA